MGIVPAPICSTRYVKDTGYCGEDRASAGDRELELHHNNVVVEQMLCANSPLQYADHSMLTFKLTKYLYQQEVLCRLF